MVADAGEPTSTCFFARLPGTSLGAGAERLEKWAVANCVEHALVRDAGGNVALYAMRSSGPCRRCAEEEPVVLMSLSEGFDERARAALAGLRAGAAY